MSGGDSVSVEWNRMVDYLRSITPRPGKGTTFAHTPHGTTYAARYEGIPRRTNSPECLQVVTVWGSAPFSYPGTGSTVGGAVNSYMSPPIDSSPFSAGEDWVFDGGTTVDCSSDTRYATITRVITRQEWGDKYDGDGALEWEGPSQVTTRTEVTDISTLDGQVTRYSVSDNHGNSYLKTLDEYGAETITGSIPSWVFVWTEGTPDNTYGASGTPTYTNTRHDETHASGTADYTGYGTAGTGSITCTRDVTLSNGWTVTSAEAACDAMMNTIGLEGGDGSVFNHSSSTSFAPSITFSQTSLRGLLTYTNYEVARLVGYWKRTTSDGLVIIFSPHTIQTDLSIPNMELVGGKLRVDGDVYNNSIDRFMKGKGRFWSTTEFAPAGWWCMQQVDSFTGWCAADSSGTSASVSSYAAGRNYFKPDDDLSYGTGAAGVTYCEIWYNSGACSSRSNSCHPSCSAPP